MSSSPPTLSRQGSGIVAFEAMTPQMQRQMSFSTASHSIIPEKHMTAQTISPKQTSRAVEDRKTYSIPPRAATDRYLNFVNKNKRILRYWFLDDCVRFISQFQVFVKIIFPWV